VSKPRRTRSADPAVENIGRADALMAESKAHRHTFIILWQSAFTHQLDHAFHMVALLPIAGEHFERQPVRFMPL
jgi:hypothetical protein